MKRLLILLLLLPVLCYGQTITNLSGAVADDDTLYIVGSGFKVKGVAAPWKYTDFDDKADGTLMQSGDGWHFQAGDRTPSYSDDRQRVGSDICLLQTFDGLVNNQVFGLYPADVDSFYFHAWTYRDDFEGSAMNSTNQKLWGNWYTDYIYAPESRFDTYFGDVTPSGHMQAAGCEGFYANDWSVGAQAHLDEWFRLERLGYQGDLDGGNGSVTSYYNCSEIKTITGNFHDCEDTWNTFLIGFYFRLDGTPNASLKVYYSEVYADSVQSRVEIGDNAVFASCTHREIQIPFLWTADGDSIGVQINQGTFSAQDTSYVFVVDRNGNASPGYEVVWGGTPGYSGTACAPDSLQVVVE